MYPNIEIKFLTPSQMEKAKDIDWRYEHVTKENLGFADPKKNRIYIRAGLENMLTQYLINHEMEHLFELEGTDEDVNGIRHKKFFKDTIMRHIFPILMSVVGTAFGGPIGGALGAFGGNTIGNTVATGKPNWGQSAIGAGTSLAGGLIGKGVGSALGKMGTETASKTPQMFGSQMGYNVGGTNAAGQAMRYGTPIFSSAAAGAGNFLSKEASTTGLGMLFSGPSSSGQGFNEPNWSGFSNNAPIPSNTFGKSMGAPGYTAPSGFGTGGQSGSIGIPTIGTGQAGIALGTQQQQGTSGGRGMNDIWGQNQSFNPMNMPGFQPMAI